MDSCFSLLCAFVLFSRSCVHAYCLSVALRALRLCYLIRNVLLYNYDQSPAQSINGSLTTQSTAVLLQEKFFSWSGDDFKITDQTGNVWCQVNGKALSLRDGMVFCDTNGNKICYMQKKLLSLRSTFQVYTYQPNKAGQESTETQDGTPVYRFAKIEKALMSMMGEYAFQLYDGNEEGEVILKARETSLLKLALKITKKSDDQQVGQVGQTSLFQVDDANKYAVEVCAGMDMMSAICLAIAVEKMREEAAAAN